MYKTIPWIMDTNRTEKVPGLVKCVYSRVMQKLFLRREGPPLIRDVTWVTIESW
jgi:hypothetical protein